MDSAHSAHANTPDHRGGRAGRAAGFTAMVLAARSASLAPSPSQRRGSRATVAGLRLGNVTAVDRQRLVMPRLPLLELRPPPERYRDGGRPQWHVTRDAGRAT